jgi:hypothetical protein
MAKDRETTKIVDTTERGKDARKSDNITAGDPKWKTEQRMPAETSQKIAGGC